jgi:hypothetical protein
MKGSAFLAFAAVLACASLAVAQDQGNTKTLTVQGPVKSVTGTSFSVDANKTVMTFMINGETDILAQGAGSKSREKRQAGQGGLAITDVVHEGDLVRVKYTTSGSSLMAREVEVRKARPVSALPVK